MLKKTLTVAALVPLIAACSDTTGAGDAGRVAVRFRASSSVSATASPSSTSQPLFNHIAAPGAITVSGTNGTLVLQDIRVIVSKLELERTDGACAAADDDECKEFEGGPFLVNPLDGTGDEVVNALIPAGSYSKFEFEVEDLEPEDDDDSGDRQTMQQILAQVRQAYPNYPSDASMVVHGTFTPTDGVAQEFTVYFNAEIEVEREFATAFRVPEDGTITVNLDPESWFRTGTQVTNLAALNGQTVEFESEFEQGIEGVEHDD